LLCYFTTVLAIEPFDPAGRIDQPLRAGVEGVAIRANLDVQLAHRGARLERVSACAGYYAAMVFRMDSGFHLLPSLRSILSSGGGFVQFGSIISSIHLTSHPGIARRLFDLVRR
jgi:hypothetical protein